MKNIKSFNSFVNEGIRDKMTPKSIEDIKSNLEGLTAREKLRKASKMDIYSKEEILKLLEEIPDYDFLKKYDTLSIENKVSYIREFGLNKLFTEDELKTLLLKRIKEFFDKSSDKEYLMYGENTEDCDGMDIFKIDNGGIVIGIDTDNIILEDGNELMDYQELNISELFNVIECYIEPIEQEEARKKRRFKTRN